MTPNDVVQRLAYISRVAQDDEAAHVAEDNLYSEVLQAIADGTCSDPQECARLALTSEAIDFSRHHA